MKKLMIISLIAASLLLAACGEKSYTVEEFVANKTLLDEYRNKCKNGEISGDSLNCQNSFKAITEMSVPTNTGSWN
ncbi:EexN family lipoprotein [Orbus wheelerorum]|uniref:EexN family lipoprotein n=1 Tax=Orbus wheelerorum TaxID=3074111 RepID=UPI00370DCE24